jgi:hypothetical protein
MGTKASNCFASDVRTHNPLVPGSNPGGPTNIPKDFHAVCSSARFSNVVKNVGTKTYSVNVPENFPDVDSVMTIAMAANSLVGVTSQYHSQCQNRLITGRSSRLLERDPVIRKECNQQSEG